MAITDICIHCGLPLIHPKAGQYYCGTTCRLRHRFGPPRPCASCGAVFQPRWKGNLYCGTPCHDLAQRRSPDLVCERCGRTFRRADALSKPYKPRFCSHACRVAADYEARTIYTLVCEQCGQAFSSRRKPTTRKPLRFCGPDCHLAALRSDEGRHGRTNDRRLRVWRAAVHARDVVCQAVVEREGVMQRCGRTDSLETHHIKSWTDYPESRFDLDNGLLLCAQHHLHHHGKAGMGALRPQRPEPTCAVCSVPISGQGATGLCHKHALEAYSARRYRTQWEKDRRLGKTCRACGVRICDDTVSGYCQAHIGPYISATRWPSKGP